MTNSSWRNTKVQTRRFSLEGAEQSLFVSFLRIFTEKQCFVVQILNKPFLLISQTDLQCFLKRFRRRVTNSSRFNGFSAGIFQGRLSSTLEFLCFFARSSKLIKILWCRIAESWNKLRRFRDRRVQNRVKNSGDKLFMKNRMTGKSEGEGFCLRRPVLMTNLQANT